MMMLPLQGFKNLMEHTKWPKRDERTGETLPSPGTPSPSAAAASSKPTSPQTVSSVFANDDRPFPVRERVKQTKRKPVSEGKEAVQEGPDKAAALSEEDEDEGKPSEFRKPVPSTGGTLR